VEPSQLTSIFKRSWYILLIAAVLGAGIARYAAQNSTPTYEAQAQLLVGPINATSDILRASGKLVLTYAELVQSETTLAAIRSKLKIDATDVISATASGSEITRLLNITVLSSNAANPDKVANQIASEIATIAASENSTNDVRPEGLITVIEPATSAPPALSPKVKLITVLGGLAGIIGATALLLAAEQLSRRIRSATELAEVAGVPVLAVLGPQRPKATGITAEARLVVSGISNSKTAISFQTAAANLSILQYLNAPLRTIVITGTSSTIGTGDIAANIAANLVDLGARVVLADADPSGGEIAALLGLNTTPAGEASQPTSVPLRGDRQLLVVTPLHSLDSGKIDATKANKLVQDLHKHADVVVIHTGPAPSSLTALVWASVADATVLVARQAGSRREEVEESANSLHRAQGRLIGTFLDARRTKRRWSPLAAPAPAADAVNEVKPTAVPH
jgi:receptor protein-tyrosine kinase